VAWSSSQALIDTVDMIERTALISHDRKYSIHTRDLKRALDLVAQSHQHEIPAWSDRLKDA
jgi:hypothetical protein